MNADFKRKKKIQVNVITGSRVLASLFMIPIYLVWGGLPTAIFCIIFFLTDMIDGKMARKYGVQSFLGALLDATCDKVLAVTALILLSINSLMMLLPILFEVLIAGVFIINFRSGKNVQASMLGKIKVWVIAVTIIGSFLALGISSIYNNYNVEYILYILLLPTVLTQLLTVITYAVKKDKRDESLKEIDEKLQVVKTIDEIKRDIIDTEFYMNNKDGGIKQLFLKESDEW